MNNKGINTHHKKETKSTNNRAFSEIIAIKLYKRRFLLIAIGVIILCMLPVMGITMYIKRITVMIMLYTVLAQGLNILTGYTGQVSLGNAGFYAIGAYTSAILTTFHNWPFWGSLVLAFIISGSIGLLLGIPTLRLRGSYLSIVTLGFGEIVRLVILNWDKVTRGTLGIRSIPSPRIFGFELTLENSGMYYLMLVILILVVSACYCIVHSKIGRAFESIREDELVATIMGINTTNYKVLAFVISASISGIAGAFYASFSHYIDATIFSFDASIEMLSIVILGGMGTIGGVIVGAILLISAPELLRFLNEYRFVMYGLILVMMMRFRPQGLFGGRSLLPYSLPKGCKKTFPEQLVNEDISKEEAV